MKVRAILFCAFLIVSAFAVKILAQGAPVAGTIEVKVPQGIDSDRDASGKQYAATVTKTVNAGGVTILHGTLAMVALVKAADGTSSVQLVAINLPSQGRVAASSSSVTVTDSPAEKASRLGSALHSRLGGIGQAAAAVTPTASGARVFLTPGSTLQFAFSMGDPATNAAGAAPAAPVAAAAPAAPPAPSPAPAASPVSASGAVASGGLTGMNICFSNPPPNPSDANHKTEYLTAVFEVPVNAQGGIPAIEPAFSAYLKATYQYANAAITCQPIWNITDAQTAQKKIASDRDTAKLKMVDTGWRYGQPPVTQGGSGFDPLAQGPGGLDLSQHRLTTYYCSLTAPGGTSMAQTDPALANEATYVTPVFQADWNSSAVDMAYDAYIRQQYVHDLSLADHSTRCVAQSPALDASMHQTALISNKRIGHVITVDWTGTPTQTAAAQAAIAAAPPPPAAPSSSGSFIACSTSGGAGIDTYLTGVFQTAKPVKRSPNGGYSVDQGILDRFYSYLTQRGYMFKPGSAFGCAIGTTAAEAEAAKHKRYYEGGGCSTCGKTVETGWKDTQ